MTWFFAVLVVLLMGVVAVVAAGVGGSMAEVYDDRPDSRVQADGPLTAEDLRRVRFTTALRGYRMSEVDALLERLAIELEAARAETLRLQGNAEASGSEPRRDQGRPTEGKDS
jgi:DivIVA domain-containing protein